MQPNVPVPTDSLYKFQALFGVLLILATMFAAAYAQVAHNEKLYAYVKDFSSYEGRDDAAALEVRRHIQDQISALNTNSRLIPILSGLSLCVGISLCWLGFVRWGKVQPLHDELLELQVAKARKEAHGSNVYRELPKRPEPKKSARKSR